MSRGALPGYKSSSSRRSAFASSHCACSRFEIGFELVISLCLGARRLAFGFVDGIAGFLVVQIFFQPRGFPIDAIACDFIPYLGGTIDHVTGRFAWCVCFRRKTRVRERLVHCFAGGRGAIVAHAVTTAFLRARAIRVS